MAIPRIWDHSGIILLPFSYHCEVDFSDTNKKNNENSHRGLFGGSTLLLFLICFCCQRKLQARTLAMAQITDIESQRQTNQNRQRRSDAHQLLPSIVSPPPDYVTAVVKDPTLPTYEAAMAEVHTNVHM